MSEGYVVHYCKSCGELLRLSHFKGDLDNRRKIYDQSPIICIFCGSTKVETEVYDKERTREAFFSGANRFGGLSGYSSDVKLHCK